MPREYKAAVALKNAESELAVLDSLMQVGIGAALNDGAGSGRALADLLQVCQDMIKALRAKLEEAANA